MNVHRLSSLEMSDELNKNDVSHLIFLTKGYQLTNYFFCSILIDFDQEKLVSFYNENRRKKKR